MGEIEENPADAGFALFVGGGPRASRLPSPDPRRQNPSMSPVQSLIDDLLLILRSGEHDTSWTRYESVGQLIAELERLRARGDDAAAEVRRLCLPTGVIDEIAVSSGWSEAWLRLTTGKHRDVLSPQHG
ncbi:hypothetical protein [Amycolatopsis sp. ATCC 39116]|uniref:hypothetical protein n=1 Tax=Amycolatopsis sp. (strain ATCC 39116 / 75iv2) TaxID=385957 RepID=UPI00037CC67A|nr:hypothetical protein [Amycolatopsis sp. ATCC 39116]